MAMCHVVARFQAGRMPAGCVGARRTWPRSARLPLGAWISLIGAKKMSPMLLGAVLAQYLGRSSGGWGVQSEISTAQPRDRERSPGPSDADCQGEGGRHGPKTLLGTRMHRGGLGSWFEALIEHQGLSGDVWTGGESWSVRWSLGKTWLYWIGAGILRSGEVRGLDHRPHDCRALSCLKDRRLVHLRGNNLEWPPVHWV